MKHATYQLILQPEPEGGFTVTVPSLPGCVTFGETLDEAREMAREAIQAYLESVARHGGDVPASGRQALMTSVEV